MMTAEILMHSLADILYRGRRINLIIPAMHVENKVMSLFQPSVLLLGMNFIITADPLGYHLVDP